MQFVYPPFYISFLSNLVKPFSIFKKIGQSLTIFLVKYDLKTVFKDVQGAYDVIQGGQRKRGPVLLTT